MADSGLSEQNFSQSLHHRHRPLPGATRHRREHRYDPEFDAVFALNKREEAQNGRWWLGEPIWVTAEKQGQRAGAYYFPGAEAEISGKRPTFWKTYDDNIPNAERVNTILSWLDLPRRERPAIYTLYFSDTDDAGHEFGPDAPETYERMAYAPGPACLALKSAKRRRLCLTPTR